MYNTSQAPRTTDKLHYEALQAGYLGYTPVYRSLFNVDNGDRKNYEFQLINGGAGLENIAEGANFPTTTGGEVGSKTIQVEEYARVIPMTRLGMATADAKTLQLAQQIGRRASIKEDQIAAAVFKNGFIGTSGYGINIDGTNFPLFGNSQAVGNTGTTQDNLLTDDLSKDSLTAATTTLMRQKDHDGQLFDIMPSKLVVAASEAHNARELIESIASTADNKNNGNVNVHQGLDLIIWAQLENAGTGFEFDTNNDTQTELADNWFLIGDRMGADNPLRFMFTIPPTFDIRDESTTANGSREYRIHMAAAARAVDYVGLVGSNGTT